MDKRSRMYSVIFSVLFVITIVSGVTLAIYTWQSISEEDSVIEGDSTCFDITYVKGNNIGSNEDVARIPLGTNYLDGLSTTIKMSVDTRCTDISGRGTLYLNTEEETSDVLINNNLLNYEVVVEGNSVDRGIINSKDSIPIYEDFEITYDVKNITVYVWVNGEYVTNDNVNEVTTGVYKGYISASAESR